MQKGTAELGVSSKAGNGIRIPGIAGQFFNVGLKLCNSLPRSGIRGDFGSGFKALELRFRGAELGQPGLAAA